MRTTTAILYDSKDMCNLYQMDLKECIDTLKEIDSSILPDNYITLDRAVRDDNKEYSSYQYQATKYHVAMLKAISILSMPKRKEICAMQIKFTLDKGAYKPEKAHAADAGYDLRAVHDGRIIDCCNDGTVFDTGVHVAIPEGYVGFVQSKSGLNVNHGVICPLGTIDAGYTGSIKVKLYNLSDEPYTVKAGDKIAQLIIQPIADTELIEADTLEETERGNNGFGSTGR